MNPSYFKRNTLLRNVSVGLTMHHNGRTWLAWRRPWAPSSALGWWLAKVLQWAAGVLSCLQSLCLSALCQPLCGADFPTVTHSQVPAGQLVMEISSVLWTVDRDPSSLPLASQLSYLLADWLQIRGSQNAHRTQRRLIPISTSPSLCFSHCLSLSASSFLCPLSVFVSHCLSTSFSYPISGRGR